MKLGDICSYRTTKFDASEIRDDDLYISTESMAPNRGGVSRATNIPESGKVTAYKQGDTLISNIRPYFKKVWQASCDGYCSNDVLVMSATESNVDYLYWLTSSDSFFDYVMATAKGTKMPRGDKTAIMNFEIPPVNSLVQRQIVAALNPIRKKISINAKLNGYLEELFDSCFKQSLNMVDETWDTASLLDIADYKNGLAMQKFRPNIGDKGLPVLKIRELGQESCGKDAERCRSDIDESVTVHDGDLVFSWSGTLLLRFWAGGDAGLNQHLFKVTSEVYPSWFYYAWTKHHLARFTMLAKDRATTMGHIKRSALEESEVLLPPKEKLTMQTKCMQPIIDQVIANKIEVRKLAALRDALLPKLMSGEIDVSKIDLTQLNSHLLHHRMQHTARIKPRPPANLVKPRPKIKPNRKRGKAVLGLNPALCQSNK